ncbi:MAG: hypothetical protein P4L91_03435 [Burkholderiaceae bacterium]|nr:hypothetical protein [Burkholderiaceae bacterium]
MAFVVNGAEWRFDGWSRTDIINSIEKVLDRIMVARERNEKIWIGDDFQTRPMLDVQDLWGLFFSEDSILLPRELGHEVAAWLARAPRYADENLPEGMLEAIEIGVDTEPQEVNIDLAWAHHNVRTGFAVACLGITRSGIHKTKSSIAEVPVHWVHDETSNRCFWRDAIDVEHDSAETLERLSSHAFPDLYFPPGVWHGLNDLSNGYLPLRIEIRKYLAVLNDYGYWIFTFPPPALDPNDTVEHDVNAHPTNQIIERRFSGFNVTMAPEKPDVRSSELSRAAREITVEGRVLYCEWHGKLEGHQNRLHIHPPIPESDDKVVIAIFHKHL